MKLTNSTEKKGKKDGKVCLCLSIIRCKKQRAKVFLDSSYTMLNEFARQREVSFAKCLPSRSDTERGDDRAHFIFVIALELAPPEGV